ARPTTPFSVGDVSAATYRIDHAALSAGLQPGQGRLQAQLTDEFPYTLGSYYYRLAMPVALKTGSTPVFVGWTDPHEVEPLKLNNAPRRVQLSACDRWKQMTRTYLRDQRDWTDFGHIDVVLFIMQQAGIDTSSAMTPPYTPGATTGYNTQLSLGG